MLGEYGDATTRDNQFIHDMTGLTEKSIFRLNQIASSNKSTWWIDTLNAIIESDDFVDFLCHATDYISDDGETAQLVLENVTSFTRSAKMSDVYAFNCQTSLSRILENARDSLANRFDSRPFYSFIDGLLKEGRMSPEDHSIVARQFDSGDYSFFGKGGNNVQT